MEPYTFTDRHGATWEITGPGAAPSWIYCTNPGRVALDRDEAVACELLRVVEERDRWRAEAAGETQRRYDAAKEAATAEDALADRIATLEEEQAAVLTLLDERSMVALDHGVLARDHGPRLVDLVADVVLMAEAGNEFGVPALEQRIAALEAERDRLKKWNDTQADSIAHLEGENGVGRRMELEARIAALEEELTALRQQEALLQQREGIIEDREATLEGLEAENARLRARVETEHLRVALAVGRERAAVAAYMQCEAEGFAAEGDHKAAFLAASIRESFNRGDHHAGTPSPGEAPGACAEFIHNGGIAAARCSRCGRPEGDHAAP